jgi:PAS domain S-box-containing protein
MTAVVAQFRALDCPDRAAVGLAAVLLERRTSLELYRSILECCPLPTFLADEKGAIVYANCAYCRMVGAKHLDEVLGDGWKKFLSPGCRERIFAEWKRMVARRIPRFERVEENMQTHDRSGALVSAIRILRVYNGYYVGFIVPEQFKDLLTTDWTTP